MISFPSINHGYKKEHYLGFRLQHIITIHIDKRFDYLLFIFCNAFEKFLSHRRLQEHILQLLGFAVDGATHKGQRRSFRVPETGTNEGATWLNLHIVACVRSFSTRAGPRWVSITVGELFGVGLDRTRQQNNMSGFIINWTYQ